MDKGFSLLCAGLLVNAKNCNRDFRHVSLTALLPFVDASYDGYWGRLHRKVLENSSEVLHFSSEPYAYVFQDRNRYMVDQCGLMICFDLNRPGLTFRTVRQAVRHGLKVWNVADSDDENLAYGAPDHFLEELSMLPLA
ncbi:hypothetical protein C4J81_05970 [Deltaproteobacteria bacterium Smac51]|nr:hypothetical protein C4J81_05970 [Deltaproteobacteria bacterium Smac51]